MVQSSHDATLSSKPILEVSHRNKDLFLIRFSLDEVQTIEMSNDPGRYYLTLPFDEFGSKAIIRMMKSIDYSLSLGLGRK